MSTDHSNELLANIDRIHTTELGYYRIQKNIGPDCVDVIKWCKEFIADKKCEVIKNGKNWYASNNCITITINAQSFTIITAHTMKPNIRVTE